MARNEHSSGDGEVKDEVLRALVEGFAKERGLNWKPARQFVAFVSHALFNHRHGVDVQDAVEHHITDGPNDGGLDAICILADGKPVFTPQEAEDLVRDGPSVEFVFVQTKVSPSFSGSEIGTFGFGIRRFLSAAADDPSADIANLNDAVKRYIAVAQVFLRSESLLNMSADPTCSFYYVTTGTWTGTPELAIRLEDSRSLINDSCRVSNVDGLPVDAFLLKQIARETRGAVSRVIDIEGMVKIPAPPDKVDNAYVGLIRGTEFIKLVSTADGGMLNRGLFYDNVRDYQGDNPVNLEIAQTLIEEQSRHHFPLLNNGVTIVAQRLKEGAGKEHAIENFQVVNGCQSTHVLFRNKDDVDDNTFIPVKIIVTKDTDMVIKVVKATNRQTQIEIERLVVLREFHKELEAFYEASERTHGVAERLYYERRLHQYSLEAAGEEKVPDPDKQIVTFPAQTVSFAGMFLNVPHECAGLGAQTTYKNIVKKHESRLFHDDHKPHPYYASIVCEKAYVRWVDRKSMSERRELMEWRYHALMLLRVAIAGHRVPALNSNAIIKYSQDLVIASRDEDKWDKACEGAWRRLREARATVSLPGDIRSIRSRPQGAGPDVQVRPQDSDFARHLIRGDQVRGEATSQDSLGSRRMEPVTESSPARDGLVVGTILWFQEQGGYGRIEAPDGTELFVDVTELGAVPPGRRQEGTAVVFEVGPDPTGAGKVMATQVRLSVEDGDVD